ncbi:helix-turn-helix transcriptional regulator [Amycolatopsis sp. H20-H5]|uniref:helix-turn-helix transcriptional regulator n=1 Tax=Amycolatopsis sp. H20-H5 TaxID=3046309 RepID=UPI002DBD4B9E|nr:helix-turn-helix transcriptional regulator [Amycolatopsis sp. H20-H5]MEC3974878.1 helix-turn-helix transcriptional regulator [Amycolatopsis sp. H20-H5]
MLNALAAEPNTELYGLEIFERTGLLSGTTYPILLRLQRDGWVHARWDREQTGRQHGPSPPHYYHLTHRGLIQARNTPVEHPHTAWSTDHAGKRTR